MTRRHSTFDGAFIGLFVDLQIGKLKNIWKQFRDRFKCKKIIQVVLYPAKKKRPEGR